MSSNQVMENLNLKWAIYYLGHVWYHVGEIGGLWRVIALAKLSSFVPIHGLERHASECHQSELDAWFLFQRKWVATFSALKWKGRKEETQTRSFWTWVSRLFAACLASRVEFFFWGGRKHTLFIRPGNAMGCLSYFFLPDGHYDFTARWSSWLLRFRRMTSLSAPPPLPWQIVTVGRMPWACWVAWLV